MNQIDILFDGYSKRNPDGTQSANCTCTLIRNSNHCIIVDTMTPWDEEKIKEKLQTLNVTPNDITIIVNTHGHSDHCGNNNIFPNASKLIMGQCASFRDTYYQHDFEVRPLDLCDGIQILATPGHTLTCVSVIVRNTNVGNVIGIVGDLFENGQDVDDDAWLMAGSENEHLQRKYRQMVGHLCDVIVPGHGPMFTITPDIRKKLQFNDD